MKITNPILFVLLLGALVGLYIFGFYYLLHSRELLFGHYFKITPCFYRAEHFGKMMFSPTTKAMGDKLVLFILPLAPVAFVLFYKRFAQLSFLDLFANLFQNIRIQFVWFFFLAIWVLLLLFWANGQQMLSTDEAFSVVNFASQPIAHTLSYYPLPNNHIFYNVLSHFVAYLLGDTLLSARCLSSLFFYVFICSNFSFWSSFLPHKTASFLLTLLISLQLFQLGFATQARGYALYYLLQWLAFVLCYRYFFVQKKDAFLLLLTLCNILGLWTIPSFLYSLVFQGLLMIYGSIKEKAISKSFLFVLIFSLLGGFLVYLPVMCYSGVQRLLANKYILEQQLGFGESIQLFFESLKRLISPAAFNLSHPSIPILLFSLSVVLLFTRPIRKLKIFPLVLLVNLVWLAVLFVFVINLKVPILRAIGFQMHISFALVLLLLFYALTRASIHPFLSISSILFFTISWAYSMLYFRKLHLSERLYGQDVPAFYTSISQPSIEISSDSRVFLSDESFMWYFILPNKERLDVNNCSFNQQRYLILSEDDVAIPKINLAQYRLLCRQSWFRIYERLH